MEKQLDLAIVGTGPAGLSAALAAQARNINYALFGIKSGSWKVEKSPVVDNYLGFPAIKGPDLNRSFLEHVEKFNPTWYSQRVEAIYAMGDSFTLMSGGEMIQARAVLLGTGVATGQPLPGEERWLGQGVSACATCDGALYRQKEIAIISYFHEAEEEALFLADLAEKVYFIQQKPFPLSEKLTQHPNVEVIHEKADSITGEETFTGIQLITGRHLPVDGCFILREVLAPDQLLPGLELEKKNVKVNRHMETNIPGVYAAGDCTGPPYQLAKAVGEGLIAALQVASYLQQVRV